MYLRGQLAWGDQVAWSVGLHGGLEHPPGEDGQEAWDEGWRGELGWAWPGHGDFVRQETELQCRGKGAQRGPPRKISLGGRERRGSREVGYPEACSPWTPRPLTPTEPLVPTRPRMLACEEKVQREAWPFGGVSSGGFFHSTEMILAQYLGARLCLQRFRQGVHRLEHLPPVAEGTLTRGGAGWDDVRPQNLSVPLSPLLGFPRGPPLLPLSQCRVPLLVGEVPPTS